MQYEIGEPPRPYVKSIPVKFVCDSIPFDPKTVLKNLVLENRFYFRVPGLTFYYPAKTGLTPVYYITQIYPVVQDELATHTESIDRAFELHSQAISVGVSILPALKSKYAGVFFEGHIQLEMTGKEAYVCGEYIAFLTNPLNGVEYPAVEKLIELAYSIGIMAETLTICYDQ